MLYSFSNPFSIWEHLKAVSLKYASITYYKRIYVAFCFFSWHIYLPHQVYSLSYFFSFYYYTAKYLMCFNTWCHEINKRKKLFLVQPILFYSKYWMHILTSPIIILVRSSDLIHLTIAIVR